MRNAYQILFNGIKREPVRLDTLERALKMLL
jgi:hypothetical protein